MQVEGGALRLLTEVGLMAAGHGRSREAELISAGLKAVRPDSAAPFVIDALGRLNAGKTEEAVAILRDALAAEPGSEETRGFLGLALKLAGRGGESEQVLRGLAESGHDPAARAMAEAILAGP